MANVFKDNVWKLDTPGASQLAPSSDRVRLKGIRWIVTAGGATAGTSKATLTNAAGDVVWDAVATATNVADESTICYDLRSGLILSVLDVGTLYLYLE